MTSTQREVYQRRFVDMLEQNHIPVTEQERQSIELADFALGRFEREGLGLIVYVNNDRYCAKELFMLPIQTCPQHRHPPVGNDPGKTETFRCRAGVVYLYLDGEPTRSPVCRAPEEAAAHYTVWREIVLRPGDQFTIPPDTAHWFQSGPDGAIISEFSSTSRDEHDIFQDPNIRRMG